MINPIMHSCLVILVVLCVALSTGCSEDSSRPAADAQIADGFSAAKDLSTRADTGLETDGGSEAGSGPDGAELEAGILDQQTADQQTADQQTADTGGSSGTVIPNAYVTGYSWFDNTPPGSAAISHPQIHQTAGGIGTWADPITVAVGHDLSSGSDVLDYPAGTRFYIPDFKRYFIVEDTCGDGPTPEDGPCHVPPSDAATWLDVWIGGESGTKSSTDACMNQLTGIHQVVLDPDSNRPVDPGEIFSNGACQI